MDTIEIKISFSSEEKKTPKIINVHNLMRITTVHELKYHLAEKYKHLNVGELVRMSYDKLYNLCVILRSYQFICNAVR